MKHGLKEKWELNYRYYDNDGFVKTEGENMQALKVKDGLFAMVSDITDDIKDNKKHFFDILELDGEDCVRLNFTQYGGCGCKYILTELEEVERLHEFLENYIKLKKKEKISQSNMLG